MGRVFVTRSVPQEGLSKLQSQFEVEVWDGRDPPPRDVLLEKISGCFGVLTMLSDRVDSVFLEAAGRELKGVANFAVGFNNIDVEAATVRGVAIGNTPGVLTDATADTAIGLMIAAGRCFWPAVRNVSELQWRNWEPMMFLGQEFRGKTVGIVGMGRIGSAVAERLHFGWGMKVLYTSRTDKTDVDQRLSAKRVELDTLLRESDVISLHTSLQKETRGLIGRDQFGLMKPNAILVNTARGEVIDQDALVQALKSGQLFAAGLDVTDPEPLPNDSPLRQLDSCIILPHIGSATFQARSKMSMMAAENLIAAVGGMPMPYGLNRVCKC
ncbi:MAG: D-glycerate dehydrogenase [Planctomycetes bacterium]|nr:D-glycerate dehydrogenase [Planctomycetota bacterium]